MKAEKRFSHFHMDKFLQMDAVEVPKKIILNEQVHQEFSTNARGSPIIISFPYANIYA